MKKNKLIEILQSIKGNPDIYIWNGLVEDHMDIDPEPIDQLMVKPNKEFVVDMLTCEYKRKHKTNKIPEEELINIHNLVNSRKYTWDYPNPYVPLKDYPEWYSSKKTVYVFNLKPTGKTYTDRLGSITY
jgi:hypothetical protein